MHTRIIVAHPRQHTYFVRGKSAWLYADEKLARYDRIRSSLGNERLFITPQQFQHAAQLLVADFISWADEQIPIDDPVEWLLTPFHRNPFSGNLLLHICWLRLLAINSQEREVIVFTESIGLARSCAALCNDSGWEFVWRGKPRFFLHWLKVNLRSSAKLAYDVLRSYVGWLGAWGILGKGHFEKFRSIELLIDAYLYTDSISKEGSFADKHLPGLYEWYRENGIPAAVYPFPVGISLYKYPKLFYQMKACSVPMLPFELLLRLGDIPRMAIECLRRGLRSGSRHQFANVDVSALVAGERFRAATSGMLPLLLAIAPSRLHDSGIKPRWLLDWFENQPIDRANAVGFDKAQCRVLALRLYSIYPMFASLFTTDREVLAGVCPREAWVSGAVMEAQLNCHDKLTRYARVPALRYEHLYRLETERPTPPTQGTALVLLLTHSEEESLAILDCALGALMLLPTCLQQVIVKPHPDFGLTRLRKVIAQRWPWALNNDRFRWETGPVRTILSEAEVIISAGTSAAIEAICQGIPVILIGRKAGLDMNPLTGADARIWKMVYEAEDLASVLREWAPVHPLPLENRLEIGLDIRRRNYEPSTPQSLALFGRLLRDERANISDKIPPNSRSDPGSEKTLVNK